jgi:hypothetical protein
MADVQPVLACEVQLITWGESPDMGPWVKLRLDDPGLLETFRGLDRATKAKPGERFDLLLARPADDSGAEAVSNAGPPPADAPPSPGASPPSRQSHPYGQLARLLFRNGFFLAPEVCRAVGTDEGFLSWIRSEPCMVAGMEGVGPCEGAVQAAHVRRIANGAGVNLKPPFSAVPLCWRHHHEQHQHGESVLGDRDWWDRRRADYLTTWARRNLESMLGVESIGDVPPATLLTWAQRAGVAHLLPREYREAA